MLAFSKIFQFRPQVKTQKNIYIFLKVTNLTKIKTSLPSTAHILGREKLVNVIGQLL